MSQLHRLHDDFARQNLLLQALLGMLSRTQWLEHLSAPPPESQRHTATDSPEPEPFVAMLLGVLSVRRRLLDLARRVQRDGPANARRGAEADRTVPTGLLR